MALSYLRLRRALSLSAALLKPIPSIASAPSPPSLSSTSTATSINPQNPSIDLIEHFPFQSRSFRSSSIVLSSRARQSYNRDNEDDKISPDAILFEGCDYNHWLITMDFPKDPKPTPEEMVETYVQTCAKVVGSVEEAKKRIYACSTTTYQGFQVDVSEEMSEKFQGLPGVVFVLPDSYIDPVHKEYGGDKYINGTIIPRPPPVQYGRTGGRYSDQNREFNRPNRPRGPYQQGNTSYDNQGSMQGDARNFGAQQNYGPPRIVERRDPMPMNNTNASGGRVDYQSNYNQGDRGNYPPQGRRDFQPGDQRNYAPPEQRNYAPPQTGSYGQGAGANFGQGAPLEQRNYAPPQTGSYGQGAGGSFGHGAGGSYGQGTGGSYGQGAGGSYRQGAGSNYGQGAGGNYGQGAGGSQGQGVGGGFGPEPGGNYGQGAGGPHGQATGSAYGQGDFRQGENQRFSNVQRTGETATGQVKY